MWTRRDALRLLTGAPLLLTACGGDDDPIVERARGEEVFGRGADWLWSRRQRNGSWRSERPGLTTGELLTPLCLLSSTDLPREDFRFPRQDALRSVDWIIDHRSREGGLGFSTPHPEHPTWATSLAIHAASRLRPRLYMDHATQFLWWLRRQQLTARNGFADHPMRGAFSRGFWKRPPADGDHAESLHLTRVAVQALDSLRIDHTDPAIRSAAAFVGRCRRPDGGFVARPELVDGPVSGMATADAVLTLASIDRGRGVGLPPEVQADLEALRTLHRVDRVPGEEDPIGLRYRYLAAAAAVFERFAGPDGWADALIRALAAEQAEDGSWAGAAGFGEDEPLVATSYALTALGGALRSWPAREERRR